MLIALFVAVESLLSVERPANFTTLVIIVGVGLVLNGMYAGLLWAKFFPNWLAIIATVLDMILAIALLVALNTACPIAAAHYGLSGADGRAALECGNWPVDSFTRCFKLWGIAGAVAG